MDTISHGGQDGAVNIVELSRTLIEAALNEIMDAQANDVCEDTGTVRNGYRDLSLTTSVGAISLRIPKLRAGTYFPEQIVDLCQDFGHGIGRNQAAIGSSSDFGAVRSKKSAIASAGTL